MNISDIIVFVLLCIIICQQIIITNMIHKYNKLKMSWNIKNDDPIKK